MISRISTLRPVQNFLRASCGLVVTGIIGVLMMPWKLVADPNGYIFTWLIAYGALLGPVGGILIADYFVCRRCRVERPRALPTRRRIQIHEWLQPVFGL